MVDEQAVAPAGQVEGDVLVGLLGGGAAVLVPDLDALAIFRQGTEALAQAVDRLAHVHLHLAPHVRVLRPLVVVVAVPVLLDVGQILPLAGGQLPVPLPEGHHRAGPVDFHPGAAAVHGDGRVGFLGPEQALLHLRQLKGRAPVLHPGMVMGFDPQHLRVGGGDFHRQVRAVHGVAPLAHRAGGAAQNRPVLFHPRQVHLHRRKHLHALLGQPVAIAEFHGMMLLSVCEKCFICAGTCRPPYPPGKAARRAGGGTAGASRRTPPGSGGQSCSHRCSRTGGPPPSPAAPSS